MRSTTIRGSAACHMKATLADHIEVTPGICGGRPCISGHRIRVQDIVAWHESQGQSPDEIVARFPQLSLADVHAALAFYFDHRDEIRQHMADDDAFAESLRSQTPSRLVTKLAGMDTARDSLSP